MFTSPNLIPNSVRISTYNFTITFEASSREVSIVRIFGREN